MNPLSAGTIPVIFTCRPDVWVCGVDFSCSDIVGVPIKPPYLLATGNVPVAHLQTLTNLLIMHRQSADAGSAGTATKTRCRDRNSPRPVAC